MFINLDGVPNEASREIRDQMLLVGCLVFVGGSGQRHVLEVERAAQRVGQPGKEQAAPVFAALLHIRQGCKGWKGASPLPRWLTVDASV